MSDYGSRSYACGQPDFELDPDSTDEFEFDLTPDLDGDTISTVTFVLPDGLTQVSSSNTDKTATIFVTGAARCALYRIICRYTTANGITRDKTLRVIGRDQ